MFSGKMASTESYPCCNDGNNTTLFSIQCDSCQEWYHGRCVGVLELFGPDIDKYHCNICIPIKGPSLYKERKNEHRHNPYEESETMPRPVQTGTDLFLAELKRRQFPSSEGIVRRMRGQQLSIPYFMQNGFSEPILVEHKEGLGMCVPPEHFSLKEVERLVGPDHMVDVIISKSQSDMKMRLGDFISCYENPVRRKVLNLLSLEFSDTHLNEVVDPPYIARRLDWCNILWQKDQLNKIPFEKPAVQKYCLLSMQNSYTDFHIDFGGTSVWYHILRGEKVFYLIPPSDANLSLYQRWQNSSTRSETFFADQVDRCYQCVVPQGYTLLLPTGWIHAVLTPKDSLVFGGNFIHSLNIPLQLKIYDIEKSTSIETRFMFPNFESLHWYAGRHLLDELADFNSKHNRSPAHLLRGARAMLNALKLWNQERLIGKNGREEVPEGIDAVKLLKDLNKEVRLAERIQNTLDPPKPERESKRKRKKPMDKDFVDITQPLSLQSLQDIKSPLKISTKNSQKKVVEIQQTPPALQHPIKLTLPKPASYPYMSPAATVAPLPEVPFNVKSEHVNGRGTVLRFKLLNRTSTSDSVYDFHDSDEEQLQIDERPKKLRDTVKVEKKMKKELGVYVVNGRPPGSGSDLVEDMDVAAEVDVVSDAPKNGIDELLKASGYNVEESSYLEKCSLIKKETTVSHSATHSRSDIISGPVSPSGRTSDAIAGILAIGLMNERHSAKVNPARQRHRHYRSEEGDGDEDHMAKVHQDDDYVYPTLDASDEEDPVFKPRGRRKMDEPWNPKARVGPVVPKTDRPIREGTKKQSVEKGLEAAAAKRAGLPAPKRQYNRKKPRLVADVSSTVVSGSLGTSSAMPVLPLNKKPEPKPKKPKKGMATVKQRLGKKLKIHKLAY